MDVAGIINGWLRRIPAWPLYIIVAVWVGYMFWLGVSGQLGAEPINRLEREYGALGLKALILGLMVTPLRKHTGVNLLKFRRAIGVSTFFLILAHFTVFVVLDIQSLERVWTEIVKRPYVTVGMLAFLMLIPLAMTSNNLALRKLGGATWRQLHKLTYPAAILGGLHYLWLVKGFQWEPIIYLGIILALLAARIRWQSRMQTA